MSCYICIDLWVFYFISYSMIRHLLVTQMIIIVILFLILFPLVSFTGIWEHILGWVYEILFFVIMFFLPWYWWSYVFFWKQQLTNWERAVTSIALSLWMSIFIPIYLTFAWIYFTEMLLLLTSTLAIMSGMLIVIATHTNKEIERK